MGISSRGRRSGFTWRICRPPVSEDGYTVAELKEPRPFSVVGLYLPERGWGEQPFYTQRIADCAYPSPTQGSGVVPRDGRALNA